MRSLTPISLLALAAWTEPCEPRQELHADAGPDATPVLGGIVEIGTGDQVFQPIVEEQELGLIRGPQGGYHFIVHARMKLMDPGSPTDPANTPSTRFSVFDEGGAQLDLANPPWHLAYRTAADDWWELPGGRIAQIKTGLVPAIYGTRVRLNLRIIDRNGRYNTDDRWVLVYDACERDPDICGLGGPGP